MMGWDMTGYDGRGMAERTVWWLVIAMMLVFVVVVMIVVVVILKTTMYHMTTSSGVHDNVRGVQGFVPAAKGPGGGGGKAKKKSASKKKGKGKDEEKEEEQEEEKEELPKPYKVEKWGNGKPRRVTVDIETMRKVYQQEDGAMKDGAAVAKQKRKKEDEIDVDD